MATKTRAPKKRETRPEARARRERQAREKQGYLDPDMAPVSIPELDEAAEDYRSARDKRMRMGVEEQEAADKLLEMMQQHKLTEYEYDGKIVRVTDILKVKVNKAKAEKNGSEE